MKYLMSYDSMHQRTIVSLLTTVNDPPNICDFVSAALFVPDADAINNTVIAKQLNDLAALGRSNCAGQVYLDVPDNEALVDGLVAALTAYDDGRLRAKMIQLKWSDENTWKDHCELDPERDAEEQLAESMAEYLAQKDKYRLGYDMALRVSGLD